MSLAGVANNLWSFGGIHILSYFAVMMLIVFVHEMGHFLVGRWCGVKVDTFSLGFGPELFGFDDRYGTHWRFAAFPLGGYVKFHGDANGASVPDNEGVAEMAAEERSVTLQGQVVWKRAAIVAAGPVANFILTLVVFIGLFMMDGRPELMTGIGTVTPGSAAQEAGVKPGDRVVRVDGNPVVSWEQFTATIVAAQDKPLTLDVNRDGANVTLVATPRVTLQDGIWKPRLGVSPQGSENNFRYIAVNPVEAVKLGANETWVWVERTGDTLKQLVLGRASLSQLSGPPGIAHALGEVAKVAPYKLLSVLAILSLSIGLFNLLPVPLLDGGHLVFFAYEAVRGRPMNARAQEFSFKVGLALIGSLFLFVNANDTLKLLGLTH